MRIELFTGTTVFYIQCHVTSETSQLKSNTINFVPGAQYRSSSVKCQKLSVSSCCPVSCEFRIFDKTRKKSSSNEIISCPRAWDVPNRWRCWQTVWVISCSVFAAASKWRTKIDKQSLSVTSAVVAITAACADLLRVHHWQMNSTQPWQQGCNHEHDGFRLIGIFSATKVLQAFWCSVASCYLSKCNVSVHFLSLIPRLSSVFIIENSKLKQCINVINWNVFWPVNELATTTKNRRKTSAWWSS